MSELETILAARKSKYGKMSDVAEFTQKTEELMRELPGYKAADETVRECLHMVIHKIGRAVSGDPYYDDNPKDIQGYCERWIEAIPKQLEMDI